MTNRVIIDIETRSVADLGKVGAHVYSEHPTTEVTHFGYRTNGVRRMWRPSLELIPDDLYALLVDPETTIVAHNAEFERTQLCGPPGQRIGIPSELIRPIARWSCTAARSAVIGLPRSLEGVCKALKMPVQKDKEGHALMLRVMKPRAARKGEDPSVIYWWEDDERMNRMSQYCLDGDVDATYDLDLKLPELSPMERETWELTLAMNDRGVLVDRAMLAAVPRMIEQAETKINAEIADKTGGAVKAVTDTGALARWLIAQGVEVPTSAKTGSPSVAKDCVVTMLDDTGLDPFVRQVLIMRQEGGGAGAKKWKAIEARLSADGRLRGAFVYCGAASTRRWSSRGIQLQNMVRGGNVPRLMDAVADLLDGYDAEFLGLVYAPPLVVAAEMQRPALVAPDGHLLARADKSQIEARVNPWLAGAQWKLNAFKLYDTFTGEFSAKGKPLRAGPDLYRVTAAGILGIPIDAVTDDQRQGQGKVPELALGFGGGAGALHNSAKSYNVVIPRHPRELNGLASKVPGGPAVGTDEWIKKKWRDNNPEIVGLWLGLETAALECMRRPLGEVVDVWTLKRTWTDGEPIIERMHKTPLTFKRNRAALCMRLPSGEGIFYWSPHVKKISTPWGEKWTLHYFAEDSVTKRWQEWPAWGGLLCENAVQSVARDIMALALPHLYSVGLHPVLLVHDEAVCEIETRDRDLAVQLVTEAMLKPISWCLDLPRAVEASAGPRYIKGA